MNKKLIPILLALAVMFCIEPARGSSPPEKQSEIPIKKLDKSNLFRSPSDFLVFYDGMSSAIYTTVTSDLGQIVMTVTNLSTGEAWSDTFDSGVIMQTLLPISGTSGLYEIEYVTESGDVYAGEFIIE